MPTPEPLPLHAIPGLRAARLRGRPKKIAPAHVQGADQRAYHERVNALRREALEHDALVLAADGDGDDLLDVVITQIAAEAAGLRWERERAQDRGLETTPMISSRIIDAYSKLSTLVLVRHELQRGAPTDAQVERVKTMFLSDIAGVVSEVLGVETAATFMARLRVRIAPREETARAPR